MRNKTHLFLLAIVVLCTLAAIVGGVLLYPPPAPELPEASTSPDGTLLNGRITAIEESEPDPDTQEVLSPDARSLTITAQLAGGRDVTFDMVDETGVTFEVGQDVRVTEIAGPDGQFTHYISDVRREQPLLILAAVFLAAVLAFGRWQGLRALVGLGITLAVVVLFVVPAVLAGRDPMLVALVASVGIMVATLYLTHGVGPKTTAAAVGTLGALGVTLALSWFFIDFASLTGLADEEARLASFHVGGLSLRGLLLAGIIIGALGVLDDVTMAQSSTVFEFRTADPDAGTPELFSRAMKVGRDHVAATINTLFLAYAGASLPLLILFSGSPDPFNVIASSEVVAVEIVRTLVGSIGLMASVPLTTMLAAWLAVRRAPATGDHAGHVPQRPVPHSPAPDAIPSEGRLRVGAPVGSARDAATPTGAPAQGPPADPVTVTARRRGEPRRGRRVREDDDATGFSDVKPFSADDDAESEWERRLRDSYKLDQLHAARQQAARQHAERKERQERDD